MELEPILYCLFHIEGVHYPTCWDSDVYVGQCS